MQSIPAKAELNIFLSNPNHELFLSIDWLIDWLKVYLTILFTHVQHMQLEMWSQNSEPEKGHTYWEEKLQGVLGQTSPCHK